MSGVARIDGRIRDRIRWHCRRGMLELDLVLNAFVECHLDGLDASRLAAFQGLLERTDPELLDLVMGRVQARDDREREVLALMGMGPCDPADALTPDPSPGGRGEIRGAIG
jgi:antitoxin CptB